MTGSPLDVQFPGPSPGDEARAPVGRAPRKPSVRSLILLLLGGALADVGLSCLGLNPIWGPQQLAILAVLGLYVLGFTVAVQASAAKGLAQRTASLAAFAERHQHRAALVLLGIGIAGALAAVWVFHAFPLTADEYAYLFEAKTFLAGRLWNPLPPLPPLFARLNILFWGGKWVAMYPPGWPLLLAAVMGLRLPPWLAAPLCGGVLLFAAIKLGRKRDGALGGVLAAALVALSPFFLFNAGSYFDLVPAAAVGLLFCWAALAFLEHPRWSNALSAGLALGMLGLIRSQDVVLFGLPFAVEFLWRARRRHYLLAPGIILAGLPFLAALLLYDHAVFGSLQPYTNLENPHIRFGLSSIDPAGHVLTLRDKLQFVAELMVKLADWSSPLLLLGYVAAFGFVAYRRRLNFLDFIFPAYVLGFMLVPFIGGYQYGPRYYFEGFPLLVLTVVSALVPLLRDPGFSRQRPLAVSLLIAHGATCLAGVAVVAPFLRTTVDQGISLRDQLQAQNLHDAVIMFHSPALPWPFSQMLPIHLTWDKIIADDPVLYVPSLPDQVEKLHRLLPDRRFYIYAPRHRGDNLRRLW
jgi:hypothetical protein